MIRARVHDIRYERHHAPLYGIGGQIDYVSLGADIELRVRLFDDGSGSGVEARGIQIIEEAIEQALNGTVVTKLVSVEEALPPGPRRIILIELRVRLFDDGSGSGVEARGIQIIEEAIEQALNGTVVTKLVSVEEALPPGPRRIIL